MISNEGIPVPIIARTDNLKPIREQLLANLVMIGEIPAPTFDERRRITFLKHRFSECGLLNCSTDEMGNGLGFLPGRVGQRNILVTAHADTPFPRTLEHALSVLPNHVIGPGVADNSLGLATLATLPAVLEHLHIQLDANLILMGATRSLGAGNLEGLRFFLSHRQLPLYAGLCLEGVQLGRLNYASLASLGFEVRCRMKNEDTQTEAMEPNPIGVLNDVMDRLRSLSLDALYRTHINLGQIEGGTAFDTPPQSALLRFEICSESDVVLAELEQRVNETAREIARKITREVISAQGIEEAIDLSVSVFARRHLGGLSPDHALVSHTRSLLQELGIQPNTVAYSSAVSAFVDHGVPAILAGITTGYNLGSVDEAVTIQPMFTGLTQIVGVLMAMDGGACD